MEKDQIISRLESIRDRSKIFNPVSEAISLSEEAKRKGFALKDFESSEKANEVEKLISSLLSYSLEESQNYGVLVVRDTEVNVYSYWNPISEEEENKILERKKREIWNKQRKNQRTWRKKGQSSKGKKVLKFPR